MSETIREQPWARWGPQARWAALAGLAAVLGLAMAELPLGLAAALLVPAGLLLILAEPAVGLGLALVAAPARAWLSAEAPGLPLDPGQAVLAVTLVAWLARGLARRRLNLFPAPTALAIAIGLFLIVGAASLWSAPSLTDGIAELAKFGQMFLVVVLVQDAGTRGRLGWLLASAVAGGALQAFVGLWQFGFADAGPDSFAILGDRFRAYGTFEQPNPYAGFMGLVWPVAAGLAIGYLTGPAGPTRPAWRAAWRRYGSVSMLAALAGLCLAALIASFSRGAWLGAAAAGLALAAFFPRRWWLGVGLAAVAVVAAQWVSARGLLPSSVGARLAGLSELTQVYDVRGAPINDENYAVVQRLAFWQTAQAMADDNPWLGVGIGNYARAYPRYALLNWPLAIGHAHNIYLNFLAETGVIGLAAYVFLWIAILSLTIRALRVSSGWQRGAALGIMGAWVHLTVHQVVDNLYVNNVHLYLGVYIGCLAVIAAPAPEAESAPAVPAALRLAKPGGEPA